MHDLHERSLTVDEDAWRTLEPERPTHFSGCGPFRELVDAGINVGVLIARSAPGFSSSRTKDRADNRVDSDHGGAVRGL